MDSLHIRPAQISDISSMVQLLKSLFALEEDFQFNPDKQEAGLRLLIEREQSVVLIAEKNNSVAGMCTGQIVISTAEGGPAMLVEDVVVHEKMRKQGIARTLLQNLMDKAAQLGVSRLQLLAAQNNTRAVSFYRHLGWHPTQLTCLRTHIPKEET